MKFTAIVALAVITSLAPAGARAQQAPQSAPGGLEITGDIVGAIGSAANEYTYAYGDFDITTGNTRGLGFSLGFEGYRFGGSSTRGRAALYPAVSYTFANGGRLSLGVPRPATDRDGRLLPDPHFAYSRRLDIGTNAALRQSFLGVVYRDNPDLSIYGLRYDGSAGPLSYALSYHRSDNGAGSETDHYALAMSRSFAGPASLPDARAYIAVEHLESSGSYTIYTIGAEAAGPRLTGGLSYSYWDDSSNTSIIEARADYAITGNLGARLSLMRADFGSSDYTFYGLGLEYRLRENIRLHASVIDSDTSADAIWELGLAWKF